MKVYQHTHEYEHCWGLVTMAFWLRYPNPFARHVLACDVVDRYVDPATGILHTTRILLKRGVLPKWGRHIIKSTESYIVEYSEIDPKSQIMRTLTRNLNHTRIMQIEERIEYHGQRRPITQPSETAAAEAARETTVARTTASIVSNFGWGLKSRIEGFGLNRFATGTSRSRDGMMYIIEMIRANKTFPLAS
ncbi:MSF1-domain-containing protein [Ramicandelaber brevisporus]|nr:MSF1-domain-containing protein [Ramicandelaber brevisporus]KAI8871353.1 MSF1-domain-containing protein [Ramicandelaber brevisporus]